MTPVSWDDSALGIISFWLLKNSRDISSALVILGKQLTDYACHCPLLKCHLQFECLFL